MVRAVNNLRRNGKERALTVLKGYLDEVGPNGDPNQKEKVLIICRLLFIKKEGWEPPGLGHAEPDVDPTVAKLFPLFPIAKSHNVPFLLVRGYASGGYSSDTPEKCVEECRNLSLIPSDLSESNFEKAASDLTQRDEFQKLYPKSKDVREAITMVLAQGEPTQSLK